LEAKESLSAYVWNHFLSSAILLLCPWYIYGWEFLYCTLWFLYLVYYISHYWYHLLTRSMLSDFFFW